MGVSYQAVLWNRQKKSYDLAIGAGIVLYMASFLGVGLATQPNITPETLIIRALGTVAFAILHLVLCIGPLCRLSPRFLPLLYNRRHLGVTMATLALGHGLFALLQYHAMGNVDPLVSLFSSNPHWDSLRNFPFQVLGFFALLILSLMVATSHDFWLHNLSAPVWKSLHMLVYLAYALLVAHVLLGVLQDEPSRVYVLLLGAGFLTISSLHVTAAWREWCVDRRAVTMSDDAWVRVARVEEIPEKRARIVVAAGERVAVFRYDGKISAVSNVCQHQNGPLGEGEIIEGCITCPWHGYQYLPESGSSPAPFTEKIPTFRTRVVDGVVWVEPVPQAAGHRVEPARCEE